MCGVCFATCFQFFQVPTKIEKKKMRIKTQPFTSTKPLLDNDKNANQNDVKSKGKEEEEDENVFITS